MKIVVFGAPGGEGREFVEQALRERHHVTARARTPGELAGFEHPEFEVIRGDVLDPQGVERAVVGRGAVVCAIGVGAERTTLREDGTRNIVNAMEIYDVSRA
jgi:putative NADH-flavin reductase